MVVEESCEPDFIKWENLGISDTSRTIRLTILTLIFFAIIIASTLGMAIFTVYSARASKEYSSTGQCPATVTKSQAYTEIKAGSKFLMGCYCQT